MAIKYIQRQSIDDEKARLLAQESGVSLTLSKLLIARGIDTKEDVYKFLNPSADDMCDPFSLYGMSDVVERINRAMANHESILIYGDYDCDGLTATSLLYTFFKTRGHKVSYYIPNRHAEGYGLHNIVIEDLAGKQNIDLIITVDCGITSKVEVEQIRQKGIDVVITDHHEPIFELLPDCPTLDPKVDKKGFYDFCGAGVAFKLVEALAGRSIALRYVALAALGTIADIVPLVGENRIIAKLGIDELNNGHISSANIMMAKLGKEKLTAIDIMFKYAPRINALGRLNDATPIIEFFTTADDETVEKTTDRLEIVNKQRQALCEDVVDDIMLKLNHYDLKGNRVIVLEDDKWNVGILGIAASKIAETFNRPVILLTKTDDIYRGSARSNGKVNIFDALSANKDFLLTFGGHAQAAGVSVNPDMFDTFVSKINEYVINSYDDSYFCPTAIYDIKLDESITYSVVEELEKLEPCGFGNPQPLFLLENAKLNFQHMGSSTHLKAYYNNIEIMAFNEAYKYYEVDSIADYIVTLQNKQFRAKKYTQGIVKSHSLVEFTDNNAEEVFALGYIMSNMLYPRREVIREIKTCNIDDIDLKDGIFGNLYIAYSKDVYDKFLSRCRKENAFIMTCVNISNTPNPYNTLVLMPTVGFEYGYFKNIYFLMAPAVPTVIGCLQSVYNADIYLCGNEKAYIDVIRRSRCNSDDEYREVYKKIISTNFFGAKDIKDLKIKLMETGAKDFFKIISTLYIMFELGIVGMDEKDGFYCINGIKNRLDYSIIYEYIKSF